MTLLSCLTMVYMCQLYIELKYMLIRSFKMVAFVIVNHTSEVHMYTRDCEWWNGGQVTHYLHACCIRAKFIAI